MGKGRRGTRKLHVAGPDSGVRRKECVMEGRKRHAKQEYATTVENRRTSHRADTRSTRRCEEKHTIYSQWRVMPIMYCTITLLVHASHFDAEHREESPTPLSAITITASTHTERQTQFFAS
ncbi:hypothetical protein O988_05010 [Pseudogymnoascus sp. VKM F-3808]|nr:hypothetical protein O988_05010 [Pseudogymnoascus sp. VKM F-3808]